ncbi:porin family protein [Spirosoma luteolum]
MNQRKTVDTDGTNTIWQPNGVDPVTDAPALATPLTPTTGSVAERLPKEHVGRRGSRRSGADWVPAGAFVGTRTSEYGVETGNVIVDKSVSTSGPPDQRNLLPGLTTVASHTALTLLPLDPLHRQPESPVVAEQPGRQPQPISVRGPSVRFVVSPDLSGVGLRNFSRPGTNLGLMLDYRLASRWSVQAGALWSTKRYEARTSDYTWPAHTYWKVKPESVSGECRMIDIPLNVRYDFVNRPRNGRFDRWFVSSGLTSYVILEEEYNYNYAKPNDPAIVNRSTYVDSTSRYGFSQLNLSAGYERAISQRLAWQVEPFLKVSLKGVGVYKVHLLSTGVFLSLRYRL